MQRSFLSVRHLGEQQKPSREEGYENIKKSTCGFDGGCDAHRCDSWSICTRVCKDE